MALTKIKTGGITDNAVTDAKVADAITVTGAQTGITQVGTLTSFASTGIDDNATSNRITLTDNGLTLKSTSYQILELQMDSDDSGSNDDAIIKFSTGSAGTLKAEMRYDESSDTFEINRSDNGNDFVLDSSGSVGIGIDSSILGDVHIKKDAPFLMLQATDGGAYPSDIKIQQDYRTSIFGTSAGDGQFVFKNNVAGAGEPKDSGDVLMVIQDNSTVGIGTDNPDANLTIANSGQATLNLRGADAGYSQGIIFQNTNGDTRGAIYYHNADNFLRFNTAGGGIASERMRIDSSGRVGFSGISPTNDGTGGTTIRMEFPQKSIINWGREVDPASSGTIIGGLGFMGNGVKHTQLHYRLGTGFEFIDVSSNRPSGDQPTSRPYTKIICSEVGFGGTSNSNSLDDYEEGTWTASLVADSTDFSGNKHTSGKYTKIGNMVMVQFGINIASPSGGVGAMQITGLPFAVSTDYADVTTSSLQLARFDNAATNNYYGKAVDGSTTITLGYNPDWTGSSFIQMDASEINGNSTPWASGTMVYHTS